MKEQASMIKKILIFFSLICVLYYFRNFFIGIIAFILLAIAHVYTNVEKDVSKTSIAQNIVKKEYILKTDVFLLTTSKDSSNYFLEGPGESSAVPVSIDDYLKYGENWHKGDPFFKNRKYVPENYHKNYVWGVLPKGTKIYISKITRTEVLNVLAKIINGNFKNIEVDCYFLMKEEGSDNPTLCPNPEYLLESPINEVSNNRKESS